MTKDKTLQVRIDIRDLYIVRKAAKEFSVSTSEVVRAGIYAMTQAEFAKRVHQNMDIGMNIMAATNEARREYPDVG